MNTETLRQVVCCYRLSRIARNVRIMTRSLRTRCREHLPERANFDELIEEIGIVHDNFRDLLRAKKDTCSPIPTGSSEDEAIAAFVRRCSGVVASLDTDVRRALRGVRFESRDEATEVLSRVGESLASIHDEAELAFDSIEEWLGERTAEFDNRKRPSPRRETKAAIVASVDLARYGYLSGAQDLGGLFELNRRLQEQIEIALQKAGYAPADVPLQETGDGAIVVLGGSAPARAVRFGREILNLSGSINRSIAEERYHRHFRVGIAAGEVMVQPFREYGAVFKCNLAGTPIARAVRLQAAARTGSLVFDEALRVLLREPHAAPGDGEPPEQIEVTTKPHEVNLVGWRQQVVAPAPWDDRA